MPRIPMSLFTRLVLLLVIIFVAYVLWPRKSSLDRFHAERIAQLETDAWKAAVAGGNLECALAYYRIFDGQHRLPPISCVMVAQNITRATSLFRRAPDAAGQEAAVRPLSEAFAIIKRDTGADFDSAITARMLFSIWLTAAHGGNQEALAKQIAEYWSSLFGIPAGRLMAPANLRARAILEARVYGGEAETDWADVTGHLTESYQALKGILEQGDI